MLELLQQPFVQVGILVSLVLAGIHAYLGFHVVSRGVIFVDLSLAQAAAFGYVVAILAGVGEHSARSYFISLSFTLLAALLISISRTKDERIPQEAFIGIIYGGFAALSVLALSHHAEGMEIIQEIANGSILTCTIPELVTITVLYGLVGLLHYALRKQFFFISENRAAAIASGMNVLFYDFIFYSTFGLIVTSSVHIAGVLLVFSFLVIPPVTALFFTRSKGKRLAIGWAVAVIGSLAGIHFSLFLDYPAGPSIIVALIFLMLMAVGISRLAANKLPT